MRTLGLCCLLLSALCFLLNARRETPLDWFEEDIR